MPIPFAQVGSLEGLAANLGCAPSDLSDFAVADQRPFYSRLEIPKRGKRRGQFRIIHRPIQRLGLIQKNIAQWITSSTQFDTCVQGFVPRRSIGTNARLHLGASRVLHVDIRDFFDSITIEQVERAFSTLGCVAQIAKTLARISTLNGQLPQGSSSSPALANLVCRHLDADLLTLARGSNCQYSRYADDITISGNELPEIRSVAGIIATHGFALRDEKCRVQRRGRSQYVTGLTVADRLKPRVPRVQKRRLRLQMYYATRFGVGGHLDRTQSDLTVPEELARLHGWINFIYSVEGSGSLFEQWKKLEAHESTLGIEDAPRPSDGYSGES